MTGSTASATERVGRYQLLEPVGAGPTGAVWRARVFGVAGYDRQFAVKRIAPEIAASEVAAQALSAAARGYGSLEHPRIAKMTEFAIAQGQTFVAVEWVTGVDLARLVAEMRITSQPLAAGAALGIVSQVARAVGFAHGRGVSHLGISPTNVLALADGEIKVTDFGLLAASLPMRPAQDPRLHQRLAYLAPEQLATETTSAATDVFALAVLAIELVTGAPAYRGDTPAATAAMIAAGPPPLPSLPGPVTRVLHRCLARSPFERFPDARAFADSLDAALRVSPLPGSRKDLGPKVKDLLEQMAALSEDQLSGVVALPGAAQVAAAASIGNAPAVAVSRTTSSTATAQTKPLARSSASSLGLTDGPHDIPTEQYVRPDLPVAGPTPIVGPGRDARDVVDSLNPPTEREPVRPTPLPSIVSRTVTPPRSFPRAAPGTNPGATLAGGPSGSLNLPTTMPGQPPPIPAGARRPTVDSAPMRRTGPQRAVAAPPALAARAEPPAAIGGARVGEHIASDVAAVPSLAGHRRTGASATSPPPRSGPMATVFGVQAPPPHPKMLDARTQAGTGIAPTAPALYEPSEPPPFTPTPVVAEPTGPSRRSQPRDQMREQREAPPAEGWMSRGDGGADPSARMAAPVGAMTTFAAATIARPVKPSSGSLLWILGGVAALGVIGVVAYMILSTTLAGSGDTPAVTAKPAVDAPPARITADAAVRAVALDAGTGSAAVAVTASDAGTATTPKAVDAAATPTAAIDAATPPLIATAIAIDAGAHSGSAGSGSGSAGSGSGSATVTATKPPPIATGDQLVVSSTPPGAHLYLDGADQGVTPATVGGTAGQRAAVALLTGYEPYTASIAGHGNVALALKPIAPLTGGAGIKVLKCAANRYYVFVDGKPTGMLCPTERINTVIGPHTVEALDATTGQRKSWQIVVPDEHYSVRVRIDP